ncbi:hypothetical protein TUM17377_27820 [Shewanella chilikensis]|nr:hypothetical protein TUM17377_27820 [Shewanella chilikensis]
MKHLKKVLLFRVGFAEKVSWKENFFADLGLRLKSRDKKWQPKGLPYKVVQN